MAAHEDNNTSTDVKAFLFVDHTRLLQTSLSRYFNKPLFSDITVIGPDGRKLLCHQVVLSAGSKRFANMLEQGNLANEELPVWGVDSDALQSIIEFFYSGQCDLTFPTAVAVMDAANRLDVPSLSGAANTYVRDALSVQTVSTILTHALQFKLSDLTSTCLTLINDKFDDVIESKDFTQASFNCLKRILTHMQETKAVSEEELFRAAWKWTLSEPSRSSLFDSCLKIVPIPPGLSIKALIDQSNPQGAGGMAAVAALMQAAANQQAQREASEPTRSEREGGSGDGGKDASQPQTQTRGASTARDSAGTGDGDALMVDVKTEKGVNGASSAPNTSAAPQGTLSSFDPLSGQPTPTSKALTGPMDGSAFGGAGGPADMAAAAAAAAAAGIDPSSMDPQQYAAMYGSSAQGSGAAAAADGSVSGAEGGPPSPGKMGSWGGPMGMQMQGMPGMVPGMPGFGMPGMPMMGPMGMGQMPPHMMNMGGMGMPGYMASGRNHAKGVCQVEGCNADLRGLRDYHLRYKICEYHLKVSSILRDGVHQRFCQQCGRFHPLQDFDGAKRSCRARLLRHNARRRKRGEEELAAMGYGNQPSAMKRGRGSFSQMTDMDDPSAAAAGGYWPMMGNMDPYMAMAMGGMAGYNPDGSYNPAMMQQYAQFGMVSPSGGVMPNASEVTGGTTGAEGVEAAAAGGGAGSSAAASKRGGSASKGKQGAPDGDWEEGEEGEGEGAQDEDRARDEVAWAAAGLEMLADVAQARSSAAGDRSRAGSDAGSKPGAEGAGKQQQQAGADAAGVKGAPSTKQQQEQQAGAGANPCSVAPLQLADSPSPHATSGGLFVGRVSPGHDAPPTEPGADDATAAAAAAAGKGARPGTPGGAAAAAAVSGGDGRQRAAGAAAAGASSSPSNDLGFRADKPGAAAGTVKG